MLPSGFWFSSCHCCFIPSKHLRLLTHGLADFVVRARMKLGTATTPATATTVATAAKNFFDTAMTD
jgi:hypothetical protein